MTSSYWERSEGDPLSQGEVLRDCPVPFFQGNPSDGSTKYLFRIDLYDLIIVTQSCDLWQCKAEVIVLCPIFTITEYEKINPDLGKSGRWEAARKGRIEGLHLLSSFTSIDNNREAMVVDFREVYSLPAQLILNHAKDLRERWRLKSPYLEDFSQAFARYFMRVGLPLELPAFKGSSKN
jgi:hypothetical protein